jgi:hypothetical protein
MNVKRFINKVRDRHKFTIEKYCEFLDKISNYKVLPLKTFQNYHNMNEVVIGLRHDCDRNIQRSCTMAIAESKHGIRSTYCILHTAAYYKKSIEEFKFIQWLGHEIAIHNDLMTTTEPGYVLNKELRDLRDNGIEITGTAAHGNKKHTDNNAFWDTHKLEDFGLEYDAYKLDYDYYFSDCTFTDLHRWHPENLNEFKPGDRIQILIHSEHWK